MSVWGLSPENNPLTRPFRAGAWQALSARGSRNEDPPAHKLS